MAAAPGGKVRVRTELDAVARREVRSSGKSVPARQATATLRRRLVLARVRTAMHAEGWLENATAFSPRDAGESHAGVRPPRFPRAVPGAGQRRAVQ